MTDLERQLREVMDQKARDAAIPARLERDVLRRARRRQIRTVLGASLTATVVVVGSIAGLQAVFRSPSHTTPGDVIDQPSGQRAVVLPYDSITYPASWSLVDASAQIQPGDPGPVLQLTNFDPGISSLRCVDGGDRTNPDAVLLRVSIGTEMGYEDAASAPPWPVELGTPPEPGPFLGLCNETNEKLFAKWTTDAGVVYTAHALIGGDATPEDRQALLDAFASLSFPSDGRPQTEDLFGDSPALILDAAETPLGPVALYVYEDTDPWIGVAGPSGSGLSGAGSVGSDVPTSDESVTMNIGANGALVWGDVSAAAVRAEFRTIEGNTFPATLVSLPPSLERSDVQAVWGFADGPTSERVTTLLYDAQGNVLNDYFPTAPREPIAHGTDPAGGPWTVYVDHSNLGDGLGFSWGGGSSGSGCCFTPLGEADLQLDGTGSGSDEPSNVTAFVSMRVASVAVVTDTGETFDGQLFPMPERYMGPAQLVVIIVPQEVTLSGNVIAYDTSGNELARATVGDQPEPVGPTTEIDVVWQRLYHARDDVSVSGNHDASTLNDLDAAAAARIDPGLSWNDSPTVVTGEVSIRGQELVLDSVAGAIVGSHVVLVSATPTGDAYCIAISTDEQGGNGYRYGHVDAQTFDECRGGWDTAG